MRALTSAVFCILLPAAALASTRTWSGNVSANWSASGNWIGGVAPSAGDDLVFGDTLGTHQPVNDFPAGTQFHSLTFNASGGAGNPAGSGYVLSGNRIVLTGGINAQAPTGIALNVPITVAAPQTWQSLSGGLTIGVVDLGVNTLTLKPGDMMLFTGPISGSGGLSVMGASAQTVVATSAVNTYTGPTTITSGYFNCNGCTIAGPVSVNGGAAIFAFSPWESNIPTTGPLTSNGGNVYVGTSGGAVNGDLSLDNAAFSISRATLTVHGAVSLANAMLNFQAQVVPQGVPIRIIDNDGTDPISGAFAGDPEGAMIDTTDFQISYHGGTGNDVTLTRPITSSTTSTTLTASPNPAYVGQAVMLRAMVAWAGGTPSGSVTFYDGARVLATQPLSGGTATATVGPLARGDHALTAQFVPSAMGVAGSTSNAVTLSVILPAVATSTTLDVSSHASKVGEAVTMTATVSSANGAPLGMVTFYDGDAPLDTEPAGAGTVSCTISTLAAAQHRLTAVFVPVMMQYEPSSSNVVVLEVTAPPPRRRAAR